MSINYDDHNDIIQPKMIVNIDKNQQNNKEVKISDDPIKPWDYSHYFIKKIL